MKVAHEIDDAGREWLLFSFEELDRVQPQALEPVEVPEIAEEHSE